MWPAPPTAFRLIVLERRPIAHALIAQALRNAGFDVAPFATMREASTSDLGREPELVVRGLAAAFALLGGQEGLSDSLGPGARSFLRATLEASTGAGSRPTVERTPLEALDGARFVVDAARLAVRALHH